EAEALEKDSDLQEYRPMALVHEEALALALLCGQNHRSRPSSPVQRPIRPHSRAPSVSPPYSPFDALSFVAFNR
ncbi:hypothetical protein BGY98DRAFT_1020493, partial [Russula aff. rugulosa BPL654]